MDISVVIVTFNSKEEISKCLNSVKKASKNLKVEIFVVDNNSHDGSADLIRKEFPNVYLIANKKNLGFSKANNQAIKRVKGRYLLILNPDTEVLEDTLTKMIGFMKGKKDVAVATCRVENQQGKLDAECRRRFPTPWRSFCHFSGLSKIFKGSKVFDQYLMGDVSDEVDHEIDACMGAFMFIRIDAVKKVGIFDEDFFFYGEDLDWCFRFKKADYKIFYTPRTKTIHLKGVSSGIKKDTEKISKATKESKKRALKESTRAMYIFYKKHYQKKYPFFITWLMFLSIWLMEKYRLSKV
jgi:GT2 family glycosyltransferase